MHPCCWPAMIQSFIQALPFVAVAAVGCKKVWDLLPKRAKPSTNATPACCSAKKETSSSSIKVTEIH